MKGQFWTIPNIISLFRIYLSIPIVYLLWSGNNYYSAVLILVILAYISDALDGFIARKLKQNSEWGKILDPLGDKILSTSLVITLYTKGLLSLGFIILVILRDLFISIFSTKIALTTNMVIQAALIGKITTFILSILYSVSILSLMNLVPIYMIKPLEYISTTMVIISGIYYLIVFLKVNGILDKKV
ncbi:MAG: CDP-alcohol phosphatidyltransferase family protein [Brevinematia bacterium]